MTADSSPTRTIIVAVVVTVVVTLGLVGALILIFLRIRRRKDKTTTENEGAENISLQYGLEPFGEDIGAHNEPPTDPISDETAVENESGTKERLQSYSKQLRERRLIMLSEICGLAILDQEVFILHRQHTDVEVYNSTTFLFKRRIKVNYRSPLEHIVSCFVNNCLYACDRGYHSQKPQILRIDPINGKVFKNWEIYESGGRLSIATDTNVILTISYRATLREYTADGKRIRDIDIGSGTGIGRVRHAVKLPNGQFVVCHGGYGDSLCRVCLLSTKQTTKDLDSLWRSDEVEILKTFGEERGGPINRLVDPIYLSVNKEGLILVLDASSKRAVLLSSNLDKPRILISEEHGMDEPIRTCFDESTDQWFVAEDHRITVCRVKDEAIERKTYDIISH